MFVEEINKWGGKRNDQVRPGLGCLQLDDVSSEGPLAWGDMGGVLGD